MKKILLFSLSLFLLQNTVIAQPPDIPGTIDYINEVLKENKRFNSHLSYPCKYFKSKKNYQKCYSDYYSSLSLSSDGFIEIKSTIIMRDCSDPIDNGRSYTAYGTQRVHHKDISRSLTTLDGVKVILKSKNSKLIFSSITKATNEYQLWEFETSYEAERCYNALTHLLKLLDSNSKYNKNNNDPFAPQNYNRSTPTKTNKHYSSKYYYTVSAPPTFQKASSSRTNIDLKLVDRKGASIIMNVSKRLPEESGLTGHSYSADYFRNLYRNEGYSIIIHKSSKTTVAGQPAFKMVFDHPVNSKLRVLEYNFFRGNYAYILTCTSEKSSFNNYEEIFRQAAISMKF